MQKHTKIAREQFVTTSSFTKSEKVFKGIRYLCAVFCAYTVWIQIIDANLIGAIIFICFTILLLLPELRWIGRWIRKN